MTESKYHSRCTISTIATEVSGFYTYNVTCVYIDSATQDALIALGVLPRESSEDIEDGKDDMCDTKAEFDSDESDSEGCLSKEQLLLKLRNLKQLNRGMKRKLQQRQREGRAMKYESESLEVRCCLDPHFYHK